MARMTATGYMSVAPTTPRWAGDYLDREHLVPGGARLLPSAFIHNQTQVLEADGDHAVGATTLTIAVALTKIIPAGALIIDETVASPAYIRVVSEAPVGALTLTVEPLLVAVGNEDVLRYMPQTVHVPSGTLVGRTFAERTAGTAFGPAADADDEVYLVVFDVSDVVNNPDVDLYRRGSVVKENYVPGWTDVSSALKAKVRAFYTTTVGAP